MKSKNKLSKLLKHLRSKISQIKFVLERRAEFFILAVPPFFKGVKNYFKIVVCLTFTILYNQPQ